MKKILLAGLATGLGLIAFAGSAYALSVSYVPGTTNTTSALTTYTTNGENMAGMLVTAVFNDGSSETKTWISDGSGTNSGSVGGTDWSLSQSDDSYGQVSPTDGSIFSTTGEWLFKGLGNIAKLTIDAGPGDTVFDARHYPNDSNNNPVEGTPGSKDGRAFRVDTTFHSAPLWDLSATYSDLVEIGTAGPVGDLYRYLSIDFSNYSGTDNGGNFSFLADTDSTTGNINPVPEPATMLLLGTGLAGIAGTMRRKKKNA